MPILTMKVVNKKFIHAINFVALNYPKLYNQSRLKEIVFGEYHEGWLGLHTNTFYDHDGTEVSRSTIKIKNGRYRVADFIETIVHELIHVLQYAENRIDNRETMELEANTVSYGAYKAYQKLIGKSEYD